MDLCDDLGWMGVGMLEVTDGDIGWRVVRGEICQASLESRPDASVVRRYWNSKGGWGCRALLVCACVWSFSIAAELALAMGLRINSYA